MTYPVTVTIAPTLTNRNRLTTAFRGVLAIPHVILVGGVGIGVGSQGDSQSAFAGESGVMGAVAVALAIVAWFAIVFAGNHIPFIRQFTAFYLRWRVRTLAYLMLLEDPYPPLGDALYPAALEIVEPLPPRNRLTVALRLLLVIPHFIVLTFVLLGWFCTTIAAWFIILFTGAYPKGIYEFGVGALRWRLRAEAYTLLMVDEYPPFSLAANAD